MQSESRMAAIVTDIMDGIQEEMLAAMSSHMRNAAAACSEVCATRLRLLQTALSRHLDEARRQGATLSSLGPQVNGHVDPKRATLVRQIRQKLAEQGETPASFLRSRSVAASQGLLSRDEFVACIASLNLAISHSDILDLFAFAVGSNERDTAVFDEVIQALDALSLGSLATGGLSPCGSLGPEAERVVARVRSAVGRSGRPFEEVFKGFCRSRATMNRADLARVLSTFEPDIDPEVVARLWRLTVPEGAPGLDFNGFCSWFCPNGRALGPTTSTPLGGLSESQMLSSLLEKSGTRSPGGLLSASMPNLGLDAFPGSPGRLAHTLTPEQLLSDWRQAPRSAWPTWPALEAGCAAPPTARSALLQDDFPTMACLSRLHGYLAAKGLTLGFAFVLYDTHMEQAVTQEGFVAAIEHHGIPISKAEAEALFGRLARRKANQVLCLYIEDLQACIASLPTPLPQVQWGKDLVKSVEKMTRSQGTTLEALFSQLGRDYVTEWDVRAILSRYSSLSSAQWANLLPLLDKNPDGTVPWQQALRWAGLDCAMPMMNGSTPSPLPAVPAAPVAAVAVAPAPPVPTPPMVRPASAPAVPVGPALAPPAPPQSPPMPTAPSFARPVPAFTSPPPPGRPTAPVSVLPPTPLPPTPVHAVGSLGIAPPGPPPTPPVPMVSSPLARPFPPSTWGRT